MENRFETVGVLGWGLMGSGIATSAQRPDKVIGLHFFNPVPRLPLVELVPSLMTSDATLDAGTV